MSAIAASPSTNPIWSCDQNPHSASDVSPAVGSGLQFNSGRSKSIPCRIGGPRARPSGSGGWLPPGHAHHGRGCGRVSMPGRFLVIPACTPEIEPGDHERHTDHEPRDFIRRRHHAEFREQLPSADHEVVNRRHLAHDVRELLHVRSSFAARSRRTRSIARRYAASTAWRRVMASSGRP